MSGSPTGLRPCIPSICVADIDIASERARYGDFPHPTFGLTGGDGLHDPLTAPQQPLRARRPHDLLPDDGYARAGPGAQHGDRPRLAAKPPLYWTLLKQTLKLYLRRRIVQDVPFGMALEGLAAADLAYQDQAA